MQSRLLVVAAGFGVATADAAPAAYRANVGPRALRLVVASIVVATGTSACSHRRVVPCDPFPRAAEVIGSVVSIESRTAVVRITRVAVAPSSRLGVRGQLARGSTIPIGFGDRAQFLRVGSSYDVSMWWSGSYQSSVRVAEDCMPSWTNHADGSRIDTSNWSRSSFRIRSQALAAAVVVVAAIFVALRRDRRRRSAQSMWTARRLPS